MLQNITLKKTAEKKPTERQKKQKNAEINR